MTDHVKKREEDTSSRDDLKDVAKAKLTLGLGQRWQVVVCVLEARVAFTGSGGAAIPASVEVGRDELTASGALPVLTET